LRAVNAVSGEVLELEATPEPIGVAASGKLVTIGAHTVPSLRLEADSLAVESGRLKRAYPGALVLSSASGKLRVVNECSLESYTEGVVAAECPALFHPEAIKAMAVAARSYSYRKAYLTGGELCDTVHCHVYRGTGGVRSSIRDAVRATAGLGALYEGEVIEAVYSSDCGGYTEGNESAWKGAKPVPYLRPVEDAPEPQGEPYCAVNRSHAWRLPLSRARLQSLFGKAAPELVLEVVDTTESGRVRRLQLTTPRREEEPSEEGVPAAKPAVREFTGEQWRRLCGLSSVKSLKFEVQGTPTGVELQGQGYGHGVGLCQFGANGMGRQGVSFDEIIRHYYSGVEVEPLPGVDEARARRAQKRLAADKRGAEGRGLLPIR
jgi:SpoIID/LytB domain protein